MWKGLKQLGIEQMINMTSKHGKIYLLVSKNDRTLDDTSQHEKIMITSTGYVGPTFSEFRARSIKEDEALADVPRVAQQDVYGLDYINW